MDTDTTGRGFTIGRFMDHCGKKCSIQKSSLATEDAIWLGIDDPEPQVMARDAVAVGVETDEATGWVPYPIPDCVLLSTRMHLTRDEVAELLPALRHFVDTGELLAPPETKDAEA